jgi:RNA polymerase sigma-70 factor (ECF subfamily)
MPKGPQKVYTEREIAQIHAFTRGELAGFKFVYSLFRQQVFSYCVYYMGDRMQAEDAFQEVFIRIHSHHNQLREAKALKSWVLLITRSVCLNLLRTSKFTPEFVSISGPEGEAFEESLNSPHQPLDHAIADDMLRVALAKIPPMYREAFLLCEFEGYDYDEIAKITQTTEANVRVRITRAKKQLRELLAPHYQYEASRSEKKERVKKAEKEMKEAQMTIEEISFGPLDENSSLGEVFA